LKINIKELQNLPEMKRDIIFQEKINELDNDNPVEATLSIVATSYGVNIKGHVKTKLKLVCDRCLGEYDYNVEVDADEDFVNESIISDDQKEYELTKGQFVEELKGRDEIDITDFLYQTIILEIPFKKICKDSCEGSEAYKKINSEKYIDERLEVFKSFSENNYNEDKNNKK